MAWKIVKFCITFFFLHTCSLCFYVCTPSDLYFSWCFRTFVYVQLLVHSNSVMFESREICQLYETNTSYVYIHAPVNWQGKQFITKLKCFQRLKKRKVSKVKYYTWIVNTTLYFDPGLILHGIKILGNAWFVYTVVYLIYTFFDLIIKFNLL